MTDVPGDKRRILIGVGSFADAGAALRLAERLVANLTAEVGGVLVEETVLAELAEMPGQRVITASGAFIVAPSRHQIRTVADSDAKAFQQMLSGLTRSKDCFFERRHGELIRELCEAAKAWDLLLLGYRETLRLTGRVVMLAPSAGASRAMLDLTEDLSRLLGASTVRMSLAPEPAEAGNVPLGSEQFPSEEALLERIGRIHASAIVVDLSAGPLRTHDQLRRLFAAARCPVFVLGAGQGEPSLEHTTQIPPAPST